MNIYLLDIPTDDGWRQRRLEKQRREAEEIKSLKENVDQLQAQFQSKVEELDRREAEVIYKEQLLKDYAPKEYKKYQQRLEASKQDGNTSMQQNDGSAINLATTAAGSTTASVGVNNNAAPATETTTSSVGSFVMICTALFLCGTSALFYGKKNRMKNEE